MYVHICMYVYKYIYIYIYIHIYICIYICAYMGRGIEMYAQEMRNYSYLTQRLLILNEDMIWMNLYEYNCIFIYVYASMHIFVF
jgi:hypothetical protein